MKVLGIIMLLEVYFAAGEQLILPEGEETRILCKVSAEGNYVINWAVNGTAISSEYMGFTVTEEEISDGMKEKWIVFTATSNVSLKCIVTDLVDVSNSLESLEINIITQGFQTLVLQWNLRREDTSGTALLSSLRRLSSSRRLFNICPVSPPRMIKHLM